MAAAGTQHRNHCPNCLWSRHVDDDVPGDRDADCAGSMEPIGVSARDDGEWALVHRCTACSTVHVNRIAGDDNPLMLMHLAVRRDPTPTPEGQVSNLMPIAAKGHRSTHSRQG